MSKFLFTQNRLGQNAKPFKIFKLKTMKDLRNEEGMLLPDKKRITKTGTFLRKYSIDELPQFINILQGEMRLVGPRPLPVEYLPLFKTKHLKRFDIKPGITGWTQVKGRNRLTWQEKLDLDVWYVENRSFWLDLKIIWLTFLKFFKNNDGHIAMEKFTGDN